MASMALVFDILAKDGASGPFKNVGNAAERAGNQTSKFGTSMAGAMKLASGALIGAGIVEGFKALYNAADESRKISALTAQVIKSTGGAAQVSAKQVGDLAAAIAKKTGVDDEAIQSGENLLLTFTNVKNVVGSGNDIFNQATKVMTDMSVALGTDASGSAIQLGKALNDPIKGVTALQRVGVSFTAAQKDQIKALVETGDTLGAQKIILAELNKEFGGAAEAAATPLAKLQQRLGDLAEQVGGYLIPMVDKAATFLNDRLLPAFSDAGSIIAGVVVPAFKVISAAVGAVVGAFNALPAPVQVAVVAMGAVALLKSPMTSALETIALKSLYMKDAIAAAATGIGGFKGAASGLLGVLGGGVGLAIAAIVGSFALLTNASQKNEHVTQDMTAAQQSFKQALQATNGVIDESVRRSAAKALQDDGLLSLAERLKISTSSLTDSVLGNKDAYKSILPVLEDYRTKLLLESMSDRTHATENKIADLDAQIAAYKRLVATHPDVVAGEKQIAAAVGESTLQTEEATQALEDWIKQLQGIAAGFTQPLSIYQDLLSQKQQAEQTSAQATADATDSSKDSWEDYAKDVTVSLDEVAAKLEEQLTNQANWRTNIALIAQYAGADVANYLAAMGKDGVDIVALMADGTTAESQRMVADIKQVIANGGNDWAAGMDTATKVMAAIGASGGRATVQSLVTSLGLGADQIRAIASQYGINLAEGVNPVLVALGRPRVIPALNGQRQAGYADGGFTGSGGKYTPAGIVHKGEFVFPQESVNRLGVNFLGAMAGLPGYAGGGFVSAADVPRPYSTAPFQVPLSTGADATMQKGFDEVRAWMTSNAGPTSFMGMAAGGVQRWLPLVLQALGMVGQPASLAQTVLRRMNQESGGNPNAINLWDSNAKAGHPSRGLMQTIPSTFAAYAMPGYNKNIVDPLSNILASMRYAVARYGSLSAAYNKKGGYELGTDWVPETGSYVLHKGEAVVPAAANSGWSGGGPMQVTLQLDGAAVTDLLDGRVVTVLTATTDRGRYSG